MLQNFNQWPSAKLCCTCNRDTRKGSHVRNKVSKQKRVTSSFSKPSQLWFCLPTVILLCFLLIVKFDKTFPDRCPTFRVTWDNCPTFYWKRGTLSHFVSVFLNITQKSDILQHLCDFRTKIFPHNFLTIIWITRLFQWSERTDEGLISRVPGADQWWPKR